MPQRPCIKCGGPTPNPTRCEPCRRAYERGRYKARPPREEYAGGWRHYSQQLRLEWITIHGYHCPGWTMPNYPGHGPHPATDLVVDHDLGILCRSCNSSKAATFDRARAKEAQQSSRTQPPPPHSPHSSH